MQWLNVNRETQNLTENPAKRNQPSQFYTSKCVYTSRRVTLNTFEMPHIKCGKISKCLCG